MSSSTATPRRAWASDRHAGRRIEQRLRAAAGSIIYTQRNNYRVVVEVPQTRQRDIRDLSGIYVTSVTGSQFPSPHWRISNAGTCRWSSTIRASFGDHGHLQSRDGSVARGRRDGDPEAVSQMICRALHAAFAGDAADFRKTVGGRANHPGRLVAVYSFSRSLRELHSSDTIISTLPSAGSAPCWR